MDYTLFENALNFYKEEKKDIIEPVEQTAKKIKPNVKSRKKTTIECKHANIVKENGIDICLNCSQQLENNIFHDKEWRFFGHNDNKRTSDPNRVHIRKNDEKDIMGDVIGMGFSDKVIFIANIIFVDVTKGKISRGNARKSLVFACIFHSLKIHGKALSHEKLMETFQISRKSALRGLREVSLNASKESVIHITYITPVNIIEDILDKFKVTNSHKNEVKVLYEKIRNKSSKINRSRPRSTASAVIYYWLSLNNKDIPLKTFANKVELSELTISKLSKEISIVLNKTPDSWL